MSELSYNLERMEREVFCFGCREYSISTIPVPICLKCKRNLITVIRDVITGRRITGEEPLCIPIWRIVEDV